MITISHQYRSQQAEIMDDFDLQGSEMKLLLTDLKRVNTLLGGTSITLDGIQQLVKQCDLSKEITILDVGCGDGEILRQCAKLGNKFGLQFSLIGLDGNPHILNIAREKSKHYHNIRYVTVDVLKENVQLPACDIALCTLFLHHFKNDSILYVLKKMVITARVGVVINDLERSKLAFYLFKVFSFVFLRTKIAAHDGLVSIARSFRRRDLQDLSRQIENINHKIKWKWAFRYQWILSPNKPN